MKPCGECQICCIQPITPDGSPAGTPCKHLTPEGCGIYWKRPSVCVGYLCNYKYEASKDIRPDISKIKLFG